VFSAVTLVSNRYILHLRQIEIKNIKNDLLFPGYHNRTVSPFGVPGEAVDDQSDEEDAQDINLEYVKPTSNQRYPLELNLSISPTGVTDPRYGCITSGKTPSEENCEY
jgi:hypothetical protein